MKWGFRLKFNRIAKILAAVSMFVVVVMGCFTFIGANGANFVVKFDDKNGLGLAIYVDEQMESPKSRLSFPTLLDQKDITLSWIPGSPLFGDNATKNILDGLGDKSARDTGWYFAFSFLLRNESNVDVDIGVDINSSKVTNSVDSAVRVAVIRDKDDWRIFAKAQEHGEIGEPEITRNQSGDILYQTESFLSPTKVCSLKYDKMRIQEAYKFTVVIWIEGNDPECTDALKNGRMTMDMSIKIV